MLLGTNDPAPFTLFNEKGKAEHWAEILADCLKKILADENLYGYYDGLEHIHDPAQEKEYLQKLRAQAQEEI